MIQASGSVHRILSSLQIFIEYLDPPDTAFSLPVT